MSVDYDEMVQEETTIDNSPLTWWEAFVLFGSDLPALSEKINELTKEADDLF